MNFKERSSILSCSALERVKNCQGSYALSRNCPEYTNPDAERGTRIHKMIGQLALTGKCDVVDFEEGEVASKLWFNSKMCAEVFFGPNVQLVWTSEERIWLTDGELQPILSGQPDLVCQVDGDNRVLVIDAKSGFMAGDVPNAGRNEQMRGLGLLLKDQTGKEPWGAICREWACDAPELLEDHWIQDFAQEAANGAYDDALKSGLRIGDWCPHCPARRYGRCPLHVNALATIVKNEAVSVMIQDLDSESLGHLARASKMAESVVEAVRNEVRERHAKGEETPGCEFAPGNIKRTLSDLEGLMIDPEFMGIKDAVPQKLSLSITDLEKAWGKKTGLKAKALKDDFNFKFGSYLSFEANKETLTIS